MEDSTKSDIKAMVFGIGGGLVALAIVLVGIFWVANNYGYANLMPAAANPASDAEVIANPPRVDDVTVTTDAADSTTNDVEAETEAPTPDDAAKTTEPPATADAHSIVVSGLQIEIPGEFVHEGDDEELGDVQYAEFATSNGLMRVTSTSFNGVFPSNMDAALESESCSGVVGSANQGHVETTLEVPATGRMLLHSLDTYACDGQSYTYAAWVLVDGGLVVDYFTEGVYEPTELTGAILAMQPTG